MIWDNTNKPNFFLVGAAKSGTTSLSSWLDSHPDLYVSPIKEPNYFSTDIDVSKFRKGYLKSFEAEDSIELKPLKKRQIAFLRDEELYAQLFKPNNFMVVLVSLTISTNSSVVGFRIIAVSDKKRGPFSVNIKFVAATFFNPGCFPINSMIGLATVG